MYSRRVDLALDIAKSFLGTWYSWGGDDPEGFDCSGFVIEVLKSVSLFPRSGDETAQGLYERFKPSSTGAPSEGCLLFWGKSANKIVHIELVIAVIGNTVFTIGASGGGSKTTTKEAAMKANAFIKIRPARLGWIACVNPFWSEEQ